MKVCVFREIVILNQRLLIILVILSVLFLSEAKFQNYAPVRFMLFDKV